MTGLPLPAALRRLRYRRPRFRPAQPSSSDGVTPKRLRLASDSGQAVFAGDHYGHPYLGTVPADMVAFFVRFGRHEEAFLYLFQWLRPGPGEHLPRGVLADGSLRLERETLRKRDLVPGLRRWRGREAALVPAAEVDKAIAWREGRLVPVVEPGPRSRLSPFAARTA